VRKEGERYKREVSRLGRESFGRDRDGMMFPQNHRDEPLGVENGIYADAVNSNGRPVSQATTLHRTGSGASVGSRPGSAKPLSTFAASGLSPSEEKENAGLGDGIFAAAGRRKISPPINSGHGTGSSGRASPQRPTSTLGRGPSDATTGAGGEAGGRVEPAENWKRAAEVTSQLKARIEAMKVHAALRPRDEVLIGDFTGSTGVESTSLMLLWA